ncbi:hypothetical protein ACJMK2_032474 [Sinanodonta woodiana]|uniref:Uncharacterized protein n=1 Tax=Sinanodonta woodiana TaxID=1069815 RepID=A0ABD3X5S7_SINWO
MVTLNTNLSSVKYFFCLVLVVVIRIGNCSITTIPTNHSPTISVDNSTILSTTLLSKTTATQSENITTIPSKAATTTLLTTGETGSFNDRTTSMKTSISSETINPTINGLSSTYTMTSKNPMTSTSHTFESSIAKWTTNPQINHTSAQHEQGNMAFEETELVILVVILSVSAITIIIAVIFGRLEFQQPKINLNNLRNPQFTVMTSI